MSHTIHAAADGETYGLVYEELCFNIMRYAGDNLSGELEGLDVYIHSFKCLQNHNILALISLLYTKHGAHVM